MATDAAPFVQSLFSDALKQHQAGDLTAAESLYRQILQSESRHADSLHLLGVIAQQQGRSDAAIDLIGKAIDIKGTSAAYHSNLGIALKASGRLVEAVAAYDAALRLTPDLTEIHLNRGMALNALGRLLEAVATYRTALCIQPYIADAFFGMANTLAALGRPAEAIAAYFCGLRIKPADAEAYSNLGNALTDVQLWGEAVDACHVAIRLKPDFADAYSNMGNALGAMQCFDDAVNACRAALRLKPDFADAYSNLGIALKDLGRRKQAVNAFQAALCLKPDFAEAYFNLGTTLTDLGFHNEAVFALVAALGIRPDYAQAHSNLGSALQDLGRLDDAVAAYDKSLRLNPDYAEVQSNRLFCLSGYADIGPQDLFVQHRRFGEHFESPLALAAVVFSNSRDQGRPLRIGIVSGDFKRHPVGQFLEPVLYNLHNDASLSLHAYSNSVSEDSTTVRLKSCFTKWTSCVGLSDAELTAAIRADGIDILLDLSGHTAKNRLLAFACRAAPVQASWLGYVGTTVLSAMDYYLADRHFVPNADLAAQFTEKIVTLSSIAAFLPPADAPKVNQLPALTRGGVTFASFNNLRKVNRACVALWSSLLRAVPLARMMVAGLPMSGAAPIVDWLKDEGIDVDRLLLRRKCSWSDFLALHNEVDIALDSFPCGGGMTTNIGLWMGVPTLTRRGQTPASGIAAAYLTHVGLTDYVTSSPLDFVVQGQRLASDLDELGRLRATLRERVAASDMADVAGVADSLRRALRAMWVRWCNGEPPAPIFADE